MTETQHLSPQDAPVPARVRRGVRWWSLAIPLAVVACGAAAAISRGSSTKVAIASPARDVPRLDGAAIRFSPEFAARSGLEFAAAELGALSPRVTVTGTVQFDPERVAAIGARIAGRIKRVTKFPGDHVKAGEVVAELESVELGRAHAALTAALARKTAADANETREAALAEQHVTSRRDAELAHANAVAVRADVTASEQALRAMTGNVSMTHVGILPLTSPLEGKVVELHVSRGQTVEPSMTAMRVADLSRLWVELDVFEREIGHVRRNDSVELSPQANLQNVVLGTVGHVGDVIDLDTRSAKVRVEVDNREGKLRPGQSVLAKINLQTAPQALLLPRDAVTSVDGKPTVFVVRDATSVEPRVVVLGARDGARIEVRNGLEPSERVVVKGVFALKSEVFR